MKDNKTIEMFESIPTFETYSKYSQTLARMFQRASFKNLLYELRHPRRFNSPEYSQFKQSTSPEKNLYIII